MIVATIDAGFPPFGGAQISILSLLKRLQERGYPVLYVDRLRTGRARQARRWGIPCRLFRDLEELKQILVQAQPRLVIASLGTIAPAVALQDTLAAPVVAYLQSFELCPPDESERRAWLIREDRAYPGRDQCRAILARACRIWVNSLFLQERLQRLFALSSRVVYPEILPQHLPRRVQPEAIVGVCGYPYKGSHIFLDLAAHFPEHKFCLVGALHPHIAGQISQLANLEHLPFTSAHQFLGKARILLAPSQWPEPFGRVAVEALASGIPCLASHTGGLPEIVGEGVKDFRNPLAWREALRQLLVQPSPNAPDPHRFLCGQAVVQVEECLTPEESSRRLRVRRSLQAGTDQLSAFSRIARRWKAAWSQRSDLQLVDELPDEWIHFDYRDDFASLEPPPSGWAIAARTWDFGPYPRDWTEKIVREFDQLWVFSRWTRACAIRSGIPPARVRVVPPGFDPEVFRPGPQPVAQVCRFLFVGAAVHRKGFDILMKAWQLAFTPNDRVQLVLKLHTRDVFYQGIMQKVEGSPAAPIEIIDEELEPERLADLMRSCHFGVFPYRAEGFAMPIVESMACALPCLVPRFGASLDYCRVDNSLQLPIRRICLPVTRTMAVNTLGFEAQVDEVDFCEMSPQVLAEGLRQAAHMSASQRLRRGQRAAQQVHQTLTWQHSLAHAEASFERLHGLPVRILQQRRQQMRQQRQFEAAKKLFLEG